MVTDRIIALLEKGVTPWKRNWATYGIAKNYVSNRAYNGINRILMNNTDHQVPYFLSFKQAKEMGGKVKEGAKGEQVFFFAKFYKDANGNTIPEEKAKRLKAAGVKIKSLVVEILLELFFFSSKNKIPHFLQYRIHSNFVFYDE